MQNQVKLHSRRKIVLKRVVLACNNKGKKKKSRANLNSGWKRSPHIFFKSNHGHGVNLVATSSTLLHTAWTSFFVILLYYTLIKYFVFKPSIFVYLNTLITIDFSCVYSIQVKPSSNYRLYLISSYPISKFVVSEQCGMFILFCTFVFGYFFCF